MKKPQAAASPNVVEAAAWGFVFCKVEEHVCCSRVFCAFDGG